MRNPTPLRSRRLGGRVLAPLACAALAACAGDSDAGTGPQPSSAPAAVQVVSRDPHPGIAGWTLPDSVVVRVVDEAGRGVADVPVAFEVAAGGGRMLPAAARTNGDGYARAAWVLGGAGPYEATATAGDLPPAQLRARAVAVSPQATPVLGHLGESITASLSRLMVGGPGNPEARAFYDAKLALLRTPGLGGDILDGGRYAEGGVASRSGAFLPITAIFPTEAMRPEAVASLDLLEEGVRVVEDFLEIPYPAPDLELWYGFGIGSRGGGGAVHLEDRTTYDARTMGRFLPHETVVVHEMSHAWMSHETLNQMLELYGYNVLRRGSEDVAQWTHVRGYVPDRDANEGIHALLDVYRMIGPAAMAQGYRNAIPLRPLYGEPPSPAVQQAFVDAAPPALKAAVAAKMARVGI